MCKQTRKLQKNYIQIRNLQYIMVIIIMFVAHLFQNGNIQTIVSTYFLILSSFQDFQLIIDAVGLFANTHLNVFLKYSF